MPTFLELAGGSYPSQYGSNGRDITPVEGESFAHLLRSPGTLTMERQQPSVLGASGHRAARSGR